MADPLSGDNFWQQVEKSGPTFLINVLWEYDTFTTDAHIVKVRECSIDHVQMG